MPEHQYQPKNIDLVLGGQAPLPVSGVVLGGLSGVEQRLASRVVEHRIAALTEALKYGNAGLELILQALDDEASQVRDFACSVFVTSSSQLALLEKGIHIWNKWRAHSKYLEGFRVDFIGVNLSGADLSSADFSGADLSWTDLSGATLIGANLNRATLYKANLIGANLNEATLYKANLLRANLNQATLCKANVLRANLNRATLLKANLTGADLSEAYLNETNLSEANLTSANLNSAYLKGATMPDGTIHD